jgi:REP element-mobilizing transposase RayT
VAKTDEILVEGKTLKLGPQDSFETKLHVGDLLGNFTKEGYIIYNEKNEPFVEFQSGITIKDLNLQLDSMGLALFNMGGYDGQTWAGVISTSTHGSGKNLGPLVDTVRSLVLLTTSKLDCDKRQGTVFIYRIESKSYPITNPIVYKNKKIKLIQNDDIFNSVVVSMGTMGIIYSTVIQVRDKFYLHENREAAKWEDLLQNNSIISLVDKFYHAEVWVSPYEKDKTHSALVVSRHEVPKPHHAHPQFGKSLLMLFSKTFTHTRDQLGSLFLTPSHFVKFIDNNIHGTLGEYTDLSYKVYHLGDVSGEIGFGIEIMVSLGNGESYENLYLVINEIFEFAKHHKLADRYFSLPIAIRFVKRSNAYLSMMNGWELTAAVEVPMLVGADAGISHLIRLQRRLYDKFKHLKILRFHWGLDFEAFGRNYVVNNYPNFGKWLSVYKQLNRDHHFDNSWTLRMGLDDIEGSLIHSGEMLGDSGKSVDIGVVAGDQAEDYCTSEED